MLTLTFSLRKLIKILPLALCSITFHKCSDSKIYQYIYLGPCFVPMMRISIFIIFWKNWTNHLKIFFSLWEPNNQNVTVGERWWCHWWFCFGDLGFHRFCLEREREREVFVFNWLGKWGFWSFNFVPLK